jgi:hypothetical protein
VKTDPLLARYGTSRNGHSIFAPSASAMWSACAGSLLLNIDAPDDAGIEAAEGTVAHAVAQIWNQQGESAAQALLGTEGKAQAGGTVYYFTIDRTMLYHVGRFVQWCAEVPGDHYFETRVDLSPIMPIPDQGGTADHFACSFDHDGVLTITDLKYGTGVRVYADRNEQAMLYAYGVFLLWDWLYGFRRIVIRICQPRLDVFEVYECDREALLDFAAHMHDASHDAWRENAPRTPSPKACMWCCEAATCEARLAHLVNTVGATFDELCEEDREVTSVAADAPQIALSLVASASELARQSVKRLDTAALSYTLSLRSHFDGFFRAIAEELLDRAERGERLRYQSMKDGRATYKWSSQADASAALRKTYGLTIDEISPRTMLSIDKTRKLVRAKTKLAPVEIETALKPYIRRFAGKRTLASVNDSRVDSQDAADEAFSADDEL